MEFLYVSGNDNNGFGRPEEPPFSSQEPQIGEDGTTEPRNVFLSVNGHCEGKDHMDDKLALQDIKSTNMIELQDNKSIIWLS